jgi:hypothetical protein
VRPRISPDMIVTGAVGSYLIGACWLILLLTVAFSSVNADRGLDFFMAVGIGVGMVSILLWVGGCICEGIGWIGLRRLHPGLAGPVGWITVTLPATFFLFMMVGAAGLETGVIHLLMLVQVALYVMILVFLFGRIGDRSRTLPAIVGFAIALVGILGFYVMALSERFLAGNIVFLFIALTGMALGHLSLGNYFRYSAAMARSLDAFR